jgi:hypothetical protein
MSGLREAFDEIVADVPAYGDLDRAIARAERERRRRYGVVAGLAAAAAVVAVIVGMLAVTRNTDTAPPVSPTKITPTPTPPKSQSSQTWVDTAMTPTNAKGWVVPNPLDAVRDGWFQIVADHLHPSPRHAEWGPGAFELPGEDSLYSADGVIGVMEASRAEGLLANGCAYLHPTPNLDRDESCHTQQTRGPNGEPVHVTSFQSLCTTWDADSAAPGVYNKNCGDYDVTVVVERNNGRVGYIDVEGRDYVEAMPFALPDLVAAAADPRLALPDAAYDVPSNQTVASVVADQLRTWRADRDQQLIPLPEPGYASAWGKLAPFTVGVVVHPAGGAPTCGEDPWTRSCTERRVYGADDPTIVYVHARDDDEWADCCPRNTRAVSRTFVYVGPRHTVVVSESRLIPDGEPTIGAELDQALIDLALDPRFQS